MERGGFWIDSQGSSSLYTANSQTAAISFLHLVLLLLFRQQVPQVSQKLNSFPSTSPIGLPTTFLLLLLLLLLLLVYLFFFLNLSPWFFISFSFLPLARFHCWLPILSSPVDNLFFSFLNIFPFFFSPTGTNPSTRDVGNQKRRGRSVTKGSGNFRCHVKSEIKHIHTVLYIWYVHYYVMAGFFIHL